MEDFDLLCQETLDEFNEDQESPDEVRKEIFPFDVMCTPRSLVLIRQELLQETLLDAMVAEEWDVEKQYDIEMMVLLEQEDFSKRVQQIPQPQPQDSGRQDLIQYMFCVADRIKLNNVTIYVAVKLLDRTAANMATNAKTGSVFLVPAACLLIASKLHHTRGEEDQELMKYFRVNGVDGVTIGNIECSVLKVIEFYIGWITPFVFHSFFRSIFMEHFSINESRENYIRTKSEEFIMRSLTEVEFIKSNPSEIAAAATLLALNPRLSKGELTALPLPKFLQSDSICHCYTVLHNIAGTSKSKRKRKKKEQRLTSKRNHCGFIALSHHLLHNIAGTSKSKRKRKKKEQRLTSKRNHSGFED